MFITIKTLYVDDICVDENARGKHVGKTLFDYVKAYAEDNGFYNLRGLGYEAAIYVDGNGDSLNWGHLSPRIKCGA